MNSQPFYVMAAFATSAILLVLTWRAWQQRHRSEVRCFAAIGLSATLWTFFYALELAMPGLDAMLTFSKLKHIGIVWMPVTWLTFSLAYSGRPMRWDWRLYALFIVPVITLLAVLSNEVHHLYWTHVFTRGLLDFEILDYEFGPVFLLFLAYTYSMISAGIWILLRLTRSSAERYKDQTRIILWIALLPLMANLLWFVHISPLPGLDLAPFAFAASALLIARNLLRLLPDDFMPVVYETISDSFPDALMVVNRSGQVMSANPAMINVLQRGSLIGQQAAEVLPALRDLLADDPDPLRYEPLATYEELHFGQRVYELILQPILQAGQYQGHIVLLRDITVRKRIEGALLENEQRYRALFENSHDAIFLLDLDYNIVMVNEQGVHLLEVSFTRLIEANLLDYLPAQEGAALRERCQMLRQGETVPLYECTFHTPDKTSIPTEVSLTLVPNAEDQAMHWLLMVRDLRERKQAQSTLATERNLLRTLIDAIPDSIFFINARGEYTLVNQAHLRSLGLRSEREFLGRTVHDFYPPEIAEDLVRTDQIALREGQIVHQEARGMTHGQPTWYEVSKLPLRGEHNEVIGLLGIARDITSNRETEVALKARVDEMALLRQLDEEISGTLQMQHVAMLTVDAAVRLSRADAAFLALAEGEDVVVRYMLGNYPADAAERHLQPGSGVSGRVLKSKIPELVMEVSKDPDYIPAIKETVALMMLPLMSQNVLVGLLGLETKREERFTPDTFQLMQIFASRVAAALDNARLHATVKEQLAEVQGLYQQMRRLEQLKTDMIRIASHDLQNPLGIISGYLSMLQMDIDQFDPAHVEFIGAMERAVDRMRTILQDILSLERIEQQANNTPTQKLQIEYLIERATREFQQQAEAKAQTYTMHPLAPATVQGDEAQLYEAITNLIGNAIKYTPDGGSVDVWLEPDGEEVVFRVVDTGYGIPEDRQERLFEPFYRAKAEGTEHIQGTGLGLHLVKNIIERHQGQMIFESIYGQGSTFGFRLPLITENASAPN